MPFFCCITQLRVTPFNVDTHIFSLENLAYNSEFLLYISTGLVTWVSLIFINLTSGTSKLQRYIYNLFSYSLVLILLVGTFEEIALSLFSKEPWVITGLRCSFANRWIRDSFLFYERTKHIWGIFRSLKIPLRIKKTGGFEASNFEIITTKSSLLLVVS